MSAAYHLGRKGLVVSTAALFTSFSHMRGSYRLLLSEELSAGTEVAYIFLCIALVAISGLAAGLTLGLLSLDRQALGPSDRFDPSLSLVAAHPAHWIPSPVQSGPRGGQKNGQPQATVAGVQGGAGE